jgi:hypothetical protein
MIDEETVTQTILSHHNGRSFHLTMSDEFNVDGRSFSAGSDHLFEAVEKPDDTNQAIQFYNASQEYVTTKNGSLVLITRAVKTTWIQWSKDNLEPEIRTKNYTSGEPSENSKDKYCGTFSHSFTLLHVFLFLLYRHDPIMG